MVPNPSCEELLGITPDKMQVLHDVVAHDFWPVCRSLGNILKMIADDDHMTDEEKVYCTYKATQQVYTQKPDLNTVLEKVAGRLGR